MGFRFHRRIKILPGVSINLGKKGISTSIGPRGAKVTIGSKGVRTTVGLPGTGISYTKYKPYNTKAPASRGSGGYVAICPYCGHHMRKSWDRCPACGHPLSEENGTQPAPETITCPQCGKVWAAAEDLHFCPSCGHPLAAPSSPPTPAGADSTAPASTGSKTWLVILLLFIAIGLIAVCL